MAAEETILNWNVTNWVTVVLMALVGFAILAFAQKAYSKYKTGSGRKTNVTGGSQSNVS
jgi:hypothetical protein